ncbi:MAG: DegT/DnrJ/EryC1/StrS family aminotransferase [Solirubrobacteraceae bacterium]
MGVPLFDTSTPLISLREELRRAIDGVLASERYILGPEVSAFECEFAAYCGAEHAVGVANGTEAITIALRAMGVGPGDDVVVPSFTFYASAEAIPPTGARPVFCDIDPDTYCVTAETVKAALTPRTKAVLAVHLFGNVAPVEEIEALGVPVLEDAAQAAGSRSESGRPGALGTAATFSFFPSKNLGAFGDGGAITTSSEDIAERARTLRFHGSHDKVTYEQIGYNSRLDELQAAILRVQLPHLDSLADGRRRVARDYEQAGLGELVGLPRPVAGSAPAWHLYVVSHPKVERLEGALAAGGIGHKGYYRIPVHRQAAMREWGEGLELPATEHAASTHLAIPMSPVLSSEQVAEVVAAVRAA